MGKGTLLRILCWAAAYKLRLPQNESWVRGAVFSAFEGKKKEEVDEYLRDFYDSHLEKLFRAHQNDWRITGYAGTVEVERGNFNRLRLTRIAHRVSTLLVSIAPFVIRNLKLNLLTIHHARTDKKRDSVGIEASAKTHF